MRQPKTPLLVVLVLASLTSGLVWCAGPCCPSKGTGASVLSIGAAPCCGAGTPSRCQSSLQRADAATVTSVAVAHSPLVLLTGQAASNESAFVALGPPGPATFVPRQRPPALHTPLLI